MKLDFKVVRKTSEKLFKNVIQSKPVLYILSIIALLNVLFFGYIKDYQSFFTFIIIGLLMSFFSNNMIVILLSAIILSNLIKFVVKPKSHSEGVENMEEEDDNQDLIDEINEEEENIDLQDDIDNVAKDAKKEIKNIKKEQADKNKEQEEEEKMEMYKDLKKDMIEFEALQKSIMDNMKEIDPLLTKAETFVEKFEGYSAKLNK